jgi:hypothetical protein
MNYVLDKVEAHGLETTIEEPTLPGTVGSSP